MYILLACIALIDSTLTIVSRNYMKIFEMKSFRIHDSSLALRTHICSLRGGSDQQQNTLKFPQMLSDDCVLLVLETLNGTSESHLSFEMQGYFEKAEIPAKIYDFSRNPSIKLPAWPPIPQVMIALDFKYYIYLWINLKFIAVCK